MTFIFITYSSLFVSYIKSNNLIFSHLFQQSVPLFDNHGKSILIRKMSKDPCWAGIKVEVIFQKKNIFKATILSTICCLSLLSTRHYRTWENDYLKNLSVDFIVELFSRIAAKRQILKNLLRFALIFYWNNRKSANYWVSKSK